MTNPLPFDKSLLKQAGAECLAFALKKAARRVTRSYDDALRPAGIRSTQFSLLATIGCYGSLTVNELAESVVMDATTLSRNLRPLVRDGIIRSTPGKADRRRRLVSLTKKGARVLEQALPLWSTAQASMGRHLGADLTERLVGELKNVVA
ncbi:MAG: MarR family transcriptional regulator [Gemmatimonadetes bacterium]|nr:MarR family transcriptional regulator [Gemmatimonadota bacterium]